MFSSALTAFAAVALPATLAQFVPAPNDLITKQGYAGIQVRYKEVPTGICETDPDVKSYSGYSDVDENQHIFWWFFEARNQDPSTAPLTVWINGGPGSSSMIGLFQENGPCGVDYNGDVYNNPYSWSNASNMLYIDEPTQVGFSYSIPVNGYTDPGTGEIIVLPNSTCTDYAQMAGTCGTYSYANLSLTANSTINAAPNVWKTLQGFMGAFPQYSSHGFHFTTESYGGHYGPIFNEYFEQQNAKNISGAHKISLLSVGVGNGWFDPIAQYAAYYNYSVFPGNSYVGESFFNESVKEMMYNSMYGEGNCLDQLNYCASSGIDDVCNFADQFCYNEVEDVLDVVVNRDEYDVRELMPDPFPYNFFQDYLNLPHVQQAIGAYVNFSSSGGNVGVGTVGTAFEATGDDAREEGTVQAIQSLLKQGVYFMQYAGDADYNCNWLGGQVVSYEINAPGYTDAGFTNLSTSDGIVHGQVKQAGNYSFIRIYESGHEVPFYQPLAALTIFERMLKHVDIATGTLDVTDSYLTQGPKDSTYFEGNSTIQTVVVPDSATYNTTTNEPNPFNSSSATSTTAKRDAKSKQRSRKMRPASRLLMGKR
ncbi:MAG: hypothetical protein M1821_001356 [Bathelium mastoideum]|nr:MAG: hypothetical protein M1821_001356 [Bathelium mastoideum]KAI9689882.1 MAG: hypothetical protein M1822_009764 [Bathelium mastoideum]